MKVAGLFAGIGGLELGLKRAGHEAIVLCENEPLAQAVLRARFPEVRLADDVRELKSLPKSTDLVAAGFPCQDLSQAGGTRGINGQKSSVVSHVFRLLERRRVPWVLLENVPFMLQLDRGAGIRYLVKQLEDLGYRWAYRVIDTRAFGLPQRRERVFLLASLEAEPARLLFGSDRAPATDECHEGKPCGFYWTEGNRGLGWAVNAVPTLKGGSTVGIPSPPAIWMPNGRIVTPDIRDAERLQGFAPGWTEPAAKVGRASFRWRLVGNAVTVKTAEWVASRIASRPASLPTDLFDLPRSSGWPKAAFGSSAGQAAVRISTFPARRAIPSLKDFLRFEPRPLSRRATAGFTSRLAASTLRYPPEFLEALRAHTKRMEFEEASRSSA